MNSYDYQPLDIESGSSTGQTNNEGNGRISHASVTESRYRTRETNSTLIFQNSVILIWVTALKLTSAGKGTLDHSGDGDDIVVLNSWLSYEYATVRLMYLVAELVLNFTVLANVQPDQERKLSPRVVFSFATIDVCYFLVTLHGTLVYVADARPLAPLENSVLLFLVFAWVYLFPMLLAAVGFIITCPIMLCLVIFGDRYGYGRRASEEEEDSDEEENALKPISKETLMRLKTKKYEDLKHAAEGGCKTCAICLTDFQQRDSVYVLNCDSRHLYHRKCLRSWLKTNGICPICRWEIKC
mmetsp:Transcript_63982/g.73404  ORF Transcript_63982/g.73404 Transcript_63982/m.73404 type:complete len:298 (-) Transcript_63982:2280-3173(-)